ncbi:cadmium transporter [Bacillus coahuilensis m2-6]|uniref:heavy metal translocating P-type ATPase n=1 Tax=Bacillus coahuilensis TaxID=408580 RepID=UPI0001851263|nr:heavy metal translocating P-type ATPase [Bacillus coahuilensis]KUP05677.1 cadmium transporter [Bacillus coahuilensis m2-6]
MSEFKLQGLTCANCAADMEQQIKKLEHGETASLSYNRSILEVDDRVNMKTIQKILASDGAKIVQDEHEGHSHEHDAGSKMKVLLGISTSLFFLALVLGAWVNTTYLIPLFLLAMALSGYKTFIKGAKNLAKLRFTIDTLMTVALIGAVAIGEWKEATLVALLFGVNELLEGMGMEKARKSMEALLDVAPDEAFLLRDGKETIIPVKELIVGDTVLIRAGGKIPSDGTIVEGVSSVNEAAITGESLPVDKEVGSTVFGGSINNEGVLKVHITKAYEDSSLAKILHLVQEAQDTKTPTELFINRFAKYYTPIIMLIALSVILVPPLFLGGAWETWLYQGLAVLIVGCPCALILASPIAIVAGITRNARNGILVKGGVHLEQLGKIDTLAFDKTGTLTLGEPHVKKVMELNERFLPVAGMVERSSSHPLARAIMEAVNENNLRLEEADHIQTISGQGVKATKNGETFYVGNEKGLPFTLSEEEAQLLHDVKEVGYTIVLVSSADQLLGVFGITDKVREESKAVISSLHQVGIKKTVMLTGDHNKTAEKVANEVGVTTYYASLLPEEKVEKIKELSHGKIAMIGDGINDAPALATADLGIAMGKGTDSAIETADIVLMQDHLGKLPSAISIAKRVNAVIQWNIGLALGLKIIALLLTIPGWLTLWIAILSDMGATVLVTLISLSLLIEGKAKEEELSQ